MGNANVQSENLLNRIIEGQIDDYSIAELYLTKQIDLQSKELNDETAHEVAKRILEAILAIPIPEFTQILAKYEGIEPIVPAEIPQFSNIESAAIYLPSLLNTAEHPLTYLEVGYNLHECASDGAAKKYGENHAKLCISLGLGKSEVYNGLAAISRSHICKAFCEYSDEMRFDIVQRLCFRIPIVRDIALSNDREQAIKDKMNVLSKSTQRRRLHNLYELLSFALNE